MGFKMSALILCFCFAALLLKSVDCADPTDAINACHKCEDTDNKVCKITRASHVQECADKSTTGATNELIEFPQKIIIPTTYTVGDIETLFPQTANADVLQPYLCPGNILCFKRKCLVRPGDTPGDSTCPPNSETKVAKTMEKGKCWVDPKKDQGKGSATVWYISKGVGILTILMNLFM